MAFLKLGRLGQGRHGKKAQQESDDDDDDDDDVIDGDDEDEGEDGGMQDDKQSDDGDAPAQFHYRWGRCGTHRGPGPKAAARLRGPALSPCLWCEAERECEQQQASAPVRMPYLGLCIPALCESCKDKSSSNKGLGTGHRQHRPRHM